MRTGHGHAAEGSAADFHITLNGVTTLIANNTALADLRRSILLTLFVHLMGVAVYGQAAENIVEIFVASEQHVKRITKGRS